MRHARNLLAGTVLGATALVACRSSIQPFGDTPAEARYVADHVIAGLAYRVFNVQRDSQFQRARALMGQHALIPSRLYRDSSLWNDFGDSSRTLHVRGEFLGDAYRFAADLRAPHPGTLSHQRHALNLRWLGGGDHAWDLHVNHAIGPVPPSAIAGAIIATLTAAEGRTAGAALADARAAFPRAAAHLGQLFDLDSLRTEPEGGGTRVTLGISLRTDRLRTTHPRFAAYLDKYLRPTIFSARLADSAGRSYMELAGQDGAIVVRLRSRDHHLVALDDHAVTMPDDLRLHASASFRYGMFRVGFTNLVGDFLIERSEHRRAWTMRFQREPSWHFPLAVDRLIRNPLRRPFQGRGIEFILAVRDDLGPQTISERHTRLVVNESAIMRWLGRLGATAFGEFTGPTEVEENRFLYEMFAALREDVARSGEGDQDLRK